MPRQQKTKQHRILFHEVKGPWDLPGCFSGSGWDRCSGHRDLGKVEDRKYVPITATTTKNSHKQTNTYTRSSQEMLSNVSFVTPYHHKQIHFSNWQSLCQKSAPIICLVNISMTKNSINFIHGANKRLQSKSTHMGAPLFTTLYNSQSPRANGASVKPI